ncbi:MAG: aminopeptidase P family protein [Desulfobacterales bacterium]|nr:aminopeptidase P family protein [Desulfobacterales bacterium]
MTPLYRLKKLQESLKENGIHAAILIYSRDVFYYTGTAQPSYLVVLQNDYKLFVRSGYDFAIDEAFIETERMVNERDLKKIYNKNFQSFHGKIGIAFDMTTIKDMNYISEIFKGFEFCDVSKYILKQREIKDSDEIKKVRRACYAIDKGHEEAVSVLKEGITELELSAAVENAHRLSEHDGTFFFRKPDFFMSRGPVSSGPDLFKISGLVYSLTGIGLSSSVPIGPSKRVIEKGDLVIIDIPTSVNGYHADMTRTYCVGKASDEVKKLYSKLKIIVDTTIAGIKPGVRCCDIYKIAIDKSVELKTEDCFLNFGNNISLMIGHGIGIEVSEQPVISSKNQSLIHENNVIAIEMHMLSKKHGVMKIEDTILVGKDGNEILTKSSRDLAEINSKF